VFRVTPGAFLDIKLREDASAICVCGGGGVISHGSNSRGKTHPNQTGLLVSGSLRSWSERLPVT
jgi:hypothetical protein